MLMENSLSEQDRQYLEWLRTTLIPDLLESGSEATADDFVKLADMVEKYANEETRLQVQDETVQASGQSAEEAVDPASPGWGPIHADEDGQD